MGRCQLPRRGIGRRGSRAWRRATDRRGSLHMRSNHEHCRSTKSRHCAISSPGGNEKKEVRYSVGRSDEAVDVVADQPVGDVGGECYGLVDGVHVF